MSFLLGSEQVLWEHQASPNPNMPLRGLLYFARLYSAHVEKEELNLYGERLLELPTPRYVVFYNGPKDRPDRHVLRLSDSFAGTGGSIDVACEVVNINWGHNPEIAERSPTLEGYSYFVERVRVYNSVEGATLSEAVGGAMDDCIATGRLVEYLTQKRAEVFDMFKTEFDEERQRRLDRRDGFEDGMQQGLAQGLERGIEQGLERGLTNSIASLMSKTGATAEEAMELLSIPQDERARYAELIADCR